MEIKVKSEGYTNKTAPTFALDDRFGYVEFETPQGTFRVKPSNTDDGHGIPGLEIMHTEGHGVVVHPIVSNVVVVSVRPRT